MGPLWALVLLAGTATADEGAGTTPTTPPVTTAQDAALPPLGISLEPPEEIVRFRERRQAAGVNGPAAELACRPFAESLSLCFTWAADDGRRYVTGADLAAWRLGLAEVEARATARAAASLGEDRPERTQVTDMEATYWLSMEGDGLDHAAWLQPDRLDALFGPQVRVAVPARDVFIAWLGGSAELDRVMAVGVARIHDASDQPVTRKVFTWDQVEARWEVWGQASRGP